MYPGTAPEAPRLLDLYSTYLAAEWPHRLKDDTAAVVSTWALVRAPGHSAIRRRELLRDSAAHLAAPLPDNRTDFVYDPMVVLRAVAVQKAVGFTAERARLVVFLRLSSAMPRGADVANMTTAITALSSDGSEVPFPPVSDEAFGTVRVVRISGAKADKGAVARRDGRRVTAYSVLPIVGEPDICPVRALARFLSLDEVKVRHANAADNALVLSAKRKGGKYHGLSNDRINNITAASLVAAGRSESARSTRPAMANHMRRVGARDDTIEALGRWAPGSAALRRNYIKVFSDPAIDTGLPAVAPAARASPRGSVETDDSSESSQ